MTTVDLNPGDGLGPVSEWEELGRGVFSRSHRRRAANTGMIPYQVFLERVGERTISVDRVSRATPEDAAANARRVAEQRVPARNFYGWAIVSVEDVRGLGLNVVDSPYPENPYHADIILPSSAAESRDEQEHYAWDLARVANWRAAPIEPGGSAI